MFCVSQCFKYGFDFVYFPKFSVREGKYICYRLRDQKKQRKSLGIIRNPCFDSRHFQWVSGMLWSPASLKLLLFDDNTSLLWGYTTDNYGTFWSLHFVLLLLKDRILPFFPCNLFGFFRAMFKYTPFWKITCLCHGSYYGHLALWSFTVWLCFSVRVLTAFALRSLNNKIKKYIRLQEQNHQETFNKILQGTTYLMRQSSRT